MDLVFPTTWYIGKYSVKGEELPVQKFKGKRRTKNCTKEPKPGVQANERAENGLILFTVDSGS